MANEKGQVQVFLLSQSMATGQRVYPPSEERVELTGDRIQSILSSNILMRAFSFSDFKTGECKFYKIYEGNNFVKELATVPIRRGEFFEPVSYEKIAKKAGQLKPGQDVNVVIV